MTTRDLGLPAGPCPVSRLATVGGVWAAAFGEAMARFQYDHAAAGWVVDEKQADVFAAEAEIMANAAVAAFERLRARGGER